MNSLALRTFAFLISACVVTSSPVYPAMQLSHFNPIDICLFVCNICFSDDMVTEMMDCANKVCLAKEPYQMTTGMLKIGKTCKNYSKLDKYVLSNQTY